MVVVVFKDCVESGDVANLVDGTDSAWQQVLLLGKQHVIPRVVITVAIFVIVFSELSSSILACFGRLWLLLRYCSMDGRGRMEIL